jgi:hypothetical protein
MKVRDLERFRVSYRGRLVAIYEATVVMLQLTFTKIADSLSIHGGTMFIDVSHQKLSEVFHNRSANAIIGYPFDDRFRFDVTQLFQRELLKKQKKNASA